jgi:hypothetical protein
VGTGYRGSGFVDYLDYTMRTSMAALEEWHAAIRPEVDARVVWID